MNTFTFDIRVHFADNNIELLMEDFYNENLRISSITGSSLEYHMKEHPAIFFCLKNNIYPILYTVYIFILNKISKNVSKADR